MEVQYRLEGATLRQELIRMVVLIRQQPYWLFLGQIPSQIQSLFVSKMVISYLAGPSWIPVGYMLTLYQILQVVIVRLLLI